MRKRQIRALRYAATFVVSVAVGVGGSLALNQMARPVSAPADTADAAQSAPNTVQVRVRGGVAEWFDGARWNAAGALETLEQNDPTAARSEEWQLVAQQRAAAKEQQRQSALTLLSREENALATGEKPVVRQPSRRPASTAAATTPTPSGGGGGAPAPTPEPTPDPVPSGDGTDMDGGGDFWG